MNDLRTYSELIKRPSFLSRYEYLAIGGRVGEETFGFDRWVNQGFYHSSEWRRVRREVIIRDSGCDLGMDGFAINGALVVHHMNPLVKCDILEDVEWLLNPEYLITTTSDTHNAIHYGDASILKTSYVPRSPNDTKLWS